MVPCKYGLMHVVSNYNRLWVQHFTVSTFRHRRTVGNINQAFVSTQYGTKQIIMCVTRWYTLWFSVFCMCVSFASPDWQVSVTSIRPLRLCQSFCFQVWICFGGILVPTNIFGVNHPIIRLKKQTGLWPCSSRAYQFNHCLLFAQRVMN